MNNQNTLSTEWSELLYRALQAGGAAFIVSAALSNAARSMLLAHSGTQAQFNLALSTLVACWFSIGLLCLAPLALVLTRRLTTMMGFPGGYQISNPNHVRECRKAAAFSLFASPLWWLAPALLQASGH